MKSISRRAELVQALIAAKNDAVALVTENATAPIVVHRRGETEAHRHTKLLSVHWLWRKGFRQIATEVPIRAGIADAAAASSISKTQLSSICSNAKASKHRRTHVTIIVEAKATRADFAQDLSEWTPTFATGEEAEVARKVLIGKGNGREHGAGKFQRLKYTQEAMLHYVFAPKGVVKVADLPENWGLIEHDDDRARVAKKAVMVPTGPDAALALTSSIAEVWTRNAVLTPLRELHRELAQSNRNERCRNCAHFVGPRTKPKDTPAHKHGGLCQVMSAKYKIDYPVLANLTPRSVRCGSFELKGE